MSLYTAAEVLGAVKSVADGDVSFPLVMDDESAAVLRGAIDPSLSALPEHHQCDEVAFELLTVLTMGLSVGAKIERQRWRQA